MLILRVRMFLVGCILLVTAGCFYSLQGPRKVSSRLVRSGSFWPTRTVPATQADPAARSQAKTVEAETNNSTLLSMTNQAESSSSSFPSTSVPAYSASWQNEQTQYVRDKVGVPPSERNNGSVHAPDKPLEAPRLESLKRQRLSAFEKDRTSDDRFVDCERKWLGWEKYYAMWQASTDLCNGFTQITCPVLPGHTPRRAYFCFARNLIRQCRNSGSKFIAVCSRAAGLGKDFLREMPRKSPLRANEVSFDPDFVTNQVQESGPPFTYLVSGDCLTGNPGHCMADPHQLFIVQKMLGIHASSTEAIMLNGFGSSRYRNTSDHKQKLFQTSSHDSSIPLIEDWVPLASAVLRDGCADTRSEVLPLVAFNPTGMFGPHWRGFHDNPTRGSQKVCQGKSQVLMGVTEVQTATYDEWAVSAQLSTSGRFWEGWEGIKIEHCNNQTGDVLLLHVHRSSRTYVNEAEILKAAANHFIHANILSVDLGALPYIQQYHIVKQATVVFGMHGSGLSNAARWMKGARGQRMLEVHMTKGPGTTCVPCKLLGVPYAALTCKSCRKEAPKSQWIMDPLTVVKELKMLFSGQHTVPDCAAV